jgi:hypothetical protein
LYAIDLMVPLIDLDQRDSRTYAGARAAENAQPWAVGGSTLRWAVPALLLVGWTLTVAFVAAAGTAISRR